jgi:hypothetical protein
MPRPIRKEIPMRLSLGSTTLAALAATLLLVPTALAKDGDVRVAGSCSAASTAKLKLSREDSGVEVEFEVDQNRNGVRWHVVLLRNGSRVGSRTTVTRGPSGSFETRFVSSAGGRFVARANRPGEVCTVRASVA